MKIKAVMLAIKMEKGYLIKQKGENFNLPTQYSMELGLMTVKKSVVNNPDGTIRTTRTPKITGKGQIYFVNKFLKNLIIKFPPLCLRLPSLARCGRPVLARLDLRFCRPFVRSDFR